MKVKFKEKLKELEKKVVLVLDKNENGVVEPQEVLEVLKDVALSVVELKKLFKNI